MIAAPTIAINGGLTIDVLKDMLTAEWLSADEDFNNAQHLKVAKITDHKIRQVLKFTKKLIEILVLLLIHTYVEACRTFRRSL